MLNLIIGPAIDLAKDFIKGKADEKKAIQERKIATIQNDANWEAKMASGAEKSWKDEWFSILLSLPLIGVAYGVVMGDPSIIQRVNEGFASLNTLPEWYQYLLFIAVTSSFGIRGADKIMNMKKGK
jgi:hypothetical protein|tara:strand:+ start:814 stop:1191 length:378 start_codon:yes stop_codon:yes gene_type:complete